MGLSVKVYQNIKKAANDENYDFQAFVVSEEWNYKIKNLEDGRLKIIKISEVAAKTDEISVYPLSGNSIKIS